MHPNYSASRVALWYGILLYFALIDGTPRSYVFMLAGYTVALLGFPAVATPELTFDIVVSRVQEITIGIICASVVSMLVLPQSVASTVAAQADSWLAAARRLGADVLTGSSSEQERDKERMRLAAAASQIDELSGHLGYESAASANAVRGLQRLRQHMLSLLPLLAAIEDQKAALDAHGGMAAGTAEICARVARWLGEGGAGGQEADLLRAALDEAQPALSADGGWTEIMAAGLVTQLRHLVQIMQDCQVLREAIADGRDPDSLPLAFTQRQFGRRRRRIGTTGLRSGRPAQRRFPCWPAARSGSRPDGPMARRLRCSPPSLAPFSPARTIPFRHTATLSCSFSSPLRITGVYTFGVLPRITTIEMLIAALMPTFVLFGWMAARPATARVGTLLAIFTSVQIGAATVLLGELRFLRQRQHRAGVWRCARRRHLRHRSLPWHRLDRKPAAPQQLDNAGRGRRAQGVAGSRRGQQSHAASSGPACRACRRGSRRGKERCRQSSPASGGAEHHRCQAGERWPVTPRESGDRSAARASCLG